MLAVWAIQKLERRGKRQPLGEKGRSEEGRERGDFPRLPWRTPPIPTGPKQRGGGCGYPKDYAAYVQMPSRIGQFSS